jgi:hypothetical protein
MYVVDLIPALKRLGYIHRDATPRKKRFTLVLFLNPALLCIITPSFTSADNSGPSANGTFQFTLEMGLKDPSISIPGFTRTTAHQVK